MGRVEGAAPFSVGPPERRLVRGIDVASYQPRNLTDLIQMTGAEHVVVRLYLPEEEPSPEHSRDQLYSASVNGCSLGAYVWPYPDLDPVKTVVDALGVWRKYTDVSRLKVLWFDLEEGATTDEGWLQNAFLACTARGVQPGIYTRKDYWVRAMGNTVAFADYPLWLALYDGEPTLDMSLNGYPWKQAAGKQYKVEDGVDWDVFDAEFV